MSNAAPAPEARYVPRAGDRREFVTDVTTMGWTFVAGDVVTFVDTVQHLDWFAHLVNTAAGESRRIGAGVLKLHTKPHLPAPDGSTSADAHRA